MMVAWLETYRWHKDRRTRTMRDHRTLGGPDPDRYGIAATLFAEGLMRPRPGWDVPATARARTPPTLATPAAVADRPGHQVAEAQAAQWDLAGHFEWNSPDRVSLAG